MKLHNRKHLYSIRKYLRNHSTAAESTLWKLLSKRKVGGFKFRRQHSFGSYIFDFFCFELKLGIELDGEPHASLLAMDRDEARDKHLKSFGITVLRYENRWVYDYPEVIVKDILEFAKEKKG